MRGACHLFGSQILTDSIVSFLSLVNDAEWLLLLDDIMYPIVMMVIEVINGKESDKCQKDSRYCPAMPTNDCWLTNRLRLEAHLLADVFPKSCWGLCLVPLESLSKLVCPVFFHRCLSVISLIRFANSRLA